MSSGSIRDAAGPDPPNSIGAVVDNRSQAHSDSFTGLAPSAGDGHQQKDNDYEEYADQEEWPWAIRDFDTVEGEIHFYQNLIQEYERHVHETNDRMIMQFQLMLGNAYAAAGKHTDAERMLEKVRAGMEEVWGWNNVPTMACIKSLVHVYEILEKYDKVQELYETAITGVRRSMGREYPWTLELMNNWACFCVRRADLQKAWKLLGDAHKAKTHALGRSHRSTLDTLCNLRRVALDLEHGECKGMMRRAVEALRFRYDGKNINVLRAVKHLVFLRLRAGDAEKAQMLCNEFHIELPRDEDQCEMHEDCLIPALKTKWRTVEGGNISTDSLREELLKRGLEQGNLGLSALERVLSTVRKWSGMGFQEFTESLGSSRLREWSSFISPAALLEEACAAGYETAVEQLLDKYSKIDDWHAELEPRRQTAFRKGVVSGSDAVVRLLLAYDINIDDPGDNGNTALHDAAELGHEETTSLLLEIGANKHSMDRDGSIPMDLAMKAGHEGVVRIFMGHNGAILTSSTDTARPANVSGPNFDHHRKARAADFEATGFDATIVHFYTEKHTGEVDTNKPPLSDAHRAMNVAVEEFVSNKDGLLDRVLAGEATNGCACYPKADFQWIHLPANCMDWVETLMTTLRFDCTNFEVFPDLLRTELWMRQLHDPVNSSVHGRFMKPLCRELPDSIMPPVRRIYWKYLTYATANPGNLVAFMPYLHWESEEKRKEMNKVIKTAVPESWNVGLVFEYLYGENFKLGSASGNEGYNDRNQALLISHLFPDPSRRPMHLRRTLDQFQYYMTESTEDRDTDQVVSRYFKRQHPDISLPVMMIDQLWIWVLNPETVITSFPQRWDSRKGQPRDNPILDTGNVVERILDRLMKKHRAPITCVFDLAELIMAQCLGLNYDRIEWEYERYRYLEIFDYSISYVANEEIRCFNNFADGANNEDKTRNDKSQEMMDSIREGLKGNKVLRNRKQQDDKRVAANRSNRGLMNDSTGDVVSPGRTDGCPARVPLGEHTSRASWKSEDKIHARKLKDAEAFGSSLLELLLLKFNKPPTKKVRREEESFDIMHEVGLLREIKDIRDELNILSNLFAQQKFVLGPFTRVITNGRRAAAVSTGETVGNSSSRPSLVDAIEKQIAYVEQMDANAGRVYRHLEDLLDLKQKQANVYEARTTRVSGNTITVFTVVTIIFLPASFMATFLALPISEYNYVGDDKMQLGYAVKSTVITTISVAIPFIVFALYVNPIVMLIKISLGPFRKAADMGRRAASFLAIFLKLTFIALRGVFRYFHVKHFLRIMAFLPWFGFKILKTCFQLLMLVLSCLGPLSQGMREHKKEARGEGRDWRRRHFVIKMFWERIQSSEEDQHGSAGDVEEQRTESAASVRYSNTRGETETEPPRENVGEGPVNENVLVERGATERRVDSREVI